MDAATMRRLVEGATEFGVQVDDVLANRFDRLLALLLEWNRKINLTAITDPREIIERHFLDSLALVPLLGGATTVCDVGSGAGFPGAVLALCRPTLRVTTVESIRKKVAFQQTVRIQLAQNLEPVCARLEDVVRQGRTFDFVVSRATFDPADWVTVGAPLVGPHGLLVAMRTDEQSAPAPPAGFQPEPPRAYTIDGGLRHLHPFRRS